MGSECEALEKSSRVRSDELTLDCRNSMRRDHSWPIRGPYNKRITSKNICRKL